ncbi:hypothetical protein BHE74_00014535 [Ensete ventricosum]|nr:hypothetical protein GW17_00048839 [Ensete ventricosum]RWW77302.1 hypothetical protein BHE74_00014535 [Ensete ventricosum]RZR80562.1 hypothetical protein BHM03_00006627 [Ensete ventricosum]
MRNRASSLLVFIGGTFDVLLASLSDANCGRVQGVIEILTYRRRPVSGMNLRRRRLQKTPMPELYPIEDNRMGICWSHVTPSQQRKQQEEEEEEEDLLDPREERRRTKKKKKKKKKKERVGCLTAPWREGDGIERRQA